MSQVYLHECHRGVFSIETGPMEATVKSWLPALTCVDESWGAYEPPQRTSKNCFTGCVLAAGVLQFEMRVVVQSVMD